MAVRGQDDRKYRVNFGWGSEYNDANVGIRSIEIVVEANNQFDAQDKAWSMLASLELEEPTRGSAKKLGRGD